MGGMSNAHPSHLFVCASLVAGQACGDRGGSVRTKVLSKDEWLRIPLTMSPKGVEDYGAVVNRARLLVWPIVGDRRRLELSCDGGWHTERG